jgi:hypothetical protein
MLAALSDCVFDTAIPSPMPWEAGGEVEAEAEEAAEGETEHLCSRADTIPSIADVLPVPGGPWTESGIRVQISRRGRKKRREGRRREEFEWQEVRNKQVKSRVRETKRKNGKGGTWVGMILDQLRGPVWGICVYPVPSPRRVSGLSLGSPCLREVLDIVRAFCYHLFASEDIRVVNGSKYFPSLSSSPSSTAVAAALLDDTSCTVLAVLSSSDTYFIAYSWEGL